MDETVVVGGGVAGLAAATLLARAGRRVVVREAAGVLGGRARSEVRPDGFVRNLGPHALYLGGAGAGVLRGLGIDLPGGAPRIAGGVAVLEGVPLPGPFTAPALVTSRLVGTRDKAILARLLRWPPVPGFGASTTQEEWLDGLGLSARGRRLADALVRLTSYADLPERLSADAAAQQLHLGGRGVRYLDGGWASLVAALRRRAEEAGARIAVGSRVVAISGGPGSAPIVETADGVTTLAAGVVLAVGSARAEQRLLGSAGDPSPALAARAACLDVALSRLPRPTAFALGLDQPLYLSVHSAAARLAPPGGAVVHVMRYLGAAQPDPAAHREELERLLDLVQPGWRDAVVAARFSPSLTVTDELPLAESGGLPGRRPVAVGGLCALVRAGDGVGAVGMLADAALGSAAAAAGLLIGRGAAVAVSA